jgi:hypothetical protein
LKRAEVGKNAQMVSGITSVTDALGEMVQAHRAGAPAGITSFDQVRDVLRVYRRACGGQPTSRGRIAT